MMDAVLNHCPIQRFPISPSLKFQSVFHRDVMIDPSLHSRAGQWRRALLTSVIPSRPKDSQMINSESRADSHSAMNCRLEIVLDFDLQSLLFSDRQGRCFGLSKPIFLSDRDFILPV
jgi:hypothetical protein